MNKLNKKYARISIKRRTSLVQEVIQKGKPVSRSAKKLNIKLSTAKLIIKTFKETGKLLDKRMRNETKDVNGLKFQQNLENGIQNNIVQKENIDVINQDYNNVEFNMNMELFWQPQVPINATEELFYYTWPLQYWIL